MSGGGWGSGGVKHLEMPGPLVSNIHHQQQAAMWESIWYNLKLPDFYLSGPPRMSLMSAQHLLWAAARMLPIDHPEKGKPLSVLCVLNPHPTHARWTPISTAISQGCGALKGMQEWDAGEGNLTRISHLTEQSPLKMLLHTGH